MKFPSIFLGHGSPMNALSSDTPYNQAFLALGKKITAHYGKPKAVLMISAHWHGDRLRVMTAEKNPIIHDFYGFPQELYQFTYPAHGSRYLSNKVIALAHAYGLDITGDDIRGLDHGAWSVLAHFYPNADVPVVQLSLDLSKSTRWHWRLGEILGMLRDEGVMIMASGNIVHNLQMLDFKRLSSSYAYDWADDFASVINRAILDGDLDVLCEFLMLSGSGLAVPAPFEHYLPLLYAMASASGERAQLFNNDIVGGSLSMTSVVLGVNDDL